MTPRGGAAGAVVGRLPCLANSTRHGRNEKGCGVDTHAGTDNGVGLPAAVYRIWMRLTPMLAAVYIPKRHLLIARVPSVQSGAK